MPCSARWLASTLTTLLAIVAVSPAAGQISRPVPTPLVIDEWKEGERIETERRMFDW